MYSIRHSISFYCGNNIVTESFEKNCETLIITCVISQLFHRLNEITLKLFAENNNILAIKRDIIYLLFTFENPILRYCYLHVYEKNIYKTSKVLRLLHVHEKPY